MTKKSNKNVSAKKTSAKKELPAKKTSAKKELPAKKTSAKKEVPAPAPATEKDAFNVKSTIFGYPATAVVRWMSEHDYTATMARKIVEFFEADVTTGTIYTQMSRARTGLLPSGIELTKKEIKKLAEIVES